MSRRRLVDAIRSHARAQAQEAGNVIQLGEVLALDPLRVELLDADIVIEAPLLTQWVKRYHAIDGIEVGDTLVLAQRAGHWVATDVLADRAPT